MKTEKRKSKGFGTHDHKHMITANKSINCNALAKRF